MSAEPDHDFTFANYGENLTVHPRNYYRPTTEAELAAVVARVARDGESLRVVGAGHAWSAIAVSGENMISLDALDSVVAVDNDKKQVTVQAGIRLHALNDRLDELGLALPNLGSISQQSVAGATATGTHGTGLRYGNLSTLIVGMTLITADGSRLTLSQDSELLRAARVSLGLLGVVVEVTLQCVPAFDLELLAWPMPYGEAVRNLDSLVATNDHLRLYWFAGTDVIQVTAMNRSDKPRTRVNPIAEYFKEIVLHTDLLAALQATGWLFPGLVGPLNKFSAAVGWTREERVDRGDRILTITMPPRHEESEYAVPVAETARVLDELPGLIERHDYKVNLPIEVRFVAADENMLSPTFQRAGAYIGAYTFGEKFALPLFNGFEPYMKSLGGRPHWGKHLSLTAAEAQKMYPLYDRFVTLRREMDPRGVFLNDFTRAVFG